MFGASARYGGAMIKTEVMEQRKDDRIAPTIIRADLQHDGQRRQGYLINVSLGGGFFTIDDPPSPNSVSELSMLLPWGLGDCRVKARSVWLQKDAEDRAIGAGVSFEDLSDEDREKLESYLARFNELAAQITD